jgi:hypothetical protein
MVDVGGRWMRFFIRILLSALGAVLSAVLGALTAFLIGLLVMCLTPFGGPGAGVLVIFFVYVLGFMFGVAGFARCMIRLGKWRPLAGKLATAQVS